jgi:hypothetical protein
MQVKCLEIWLHLSVQKGCQGVNGSKRWRCLRVYFVVSVFCFLLESMFDARACGLSFLSIERFI